MQIGLQHHCSSHIRRSRDTVRIEPLGLLTNGYRLPPLFRSRDRHPVVRDWKPRVGSAYVYQEMRLVGMSEFDDAVEQLRIAMVRFRPIVRPYYLTGIWFFVLLSIAWDVKRYFGAHPRSIGPAATFYSIMLGGLIFDYLVERRLRREKEDSDCGTLVLNWRPSPTWLGGGCRDAFSDSS